MPLPAPLTRALQRLAAVVVLALVCAEAARVLIGFGFKITDEDQAVYWFGAQEFWHLHFREPFFYGQPYNPLLESLFAAPAVGGLGLHPWIVLPLVSTGLGIASWWLLALIAWRAGAPGWAAAIAAGPLLLPVPYLILLGFDYGGGIFVVAVATLLAELVPAETFRGFAFGLLAGLGVLFVNPNAGLLAVPAGILLLSRPGARGRRWLGLAAGGALAFVAGQAAKSFYAIHPGWEVGPPLALSWQASLLRDSARTLDVHLSYLSPWFWTAGAVPLGLLVLVAALAWAGRKRLVALAALATLAAAVLSLGLTKTHDGTTAVFFSYQRSYLGLPPAIALLLAAWRPALPRSPAVLGAIAAVAVAVVSFLAAQPTLPQTLARAAVIPAITYDGPRTVESMKAECRSLDGDSATSGATLAVFTQTRGFAYGCGALLYGRVTTLYPPYERRTWLLQQEASQARLKVLFAEVDPSFCRSPALGPDRCAPLPGEFALVIQPEPAPAVPLIRRLSVAVRLF